MRMSMLEKVAKAIFEADETIRFSAPLHFGTSEPTWELLTGPAILPYFADGYRAQAKAAIFAMRIPTAEMVDAVWRDNVLVEESSVGRSEHDLQIDTAYEVYVAMIDSALSPYF